MASLYKAAQQLSDVPCTHCGKRCPMKATEETPSYCSRDCLSAALGIDPMETHERPLENLNKRSGKEGQVTNQNKPKSTKRPRKGLSEKANNEQPVV